LFLGGFCVIVFGTNITVKKIKKSIQSLRDTFVPSKKNGHHPYIFRREAIVAVVMAILFVEAGFLVQEFVVFRKGDFLASVLPGYVMSLTNVARGEANLRVLSENELLKRAAQKKADDMATRGYFSHTGPDGKLPWQWLDLVGYNYKYAGENLAVNFTDTKELVDGWLASPAHRANIMRNNFTDIGIGMATGTYQGRETIFVVQFFGTPSAQTAVKTTALPQIKKSTSSVEIAKISPDTPVVFGTSTYNPADDISPVANISNRMGVTESMLSPGTILKNLFIAIIAIFFGLAVFGMLVHFRMPHPKVLASCIFIVALLIGVLLLNKSLFAGNLRLPTDTQSSTVINAVVRE
jgi:hypothetical protein